MFISPVIGDLLFDGYKYLLKKPLMKSIDILLEQPELLTRFV